MKKILFIFCPALVLTTVVVIALFNYTEPKGQQVPVLTYHHFLSEEEIKYFNNNENYAVSDKTFNEQMKYLYDLGYKSITLDELHCWKEKKCEIPEKSFVITIDDGLTSAHQYAEQILEKYGFNAVLFTISSRVEDTTAEWDSQSYNYIGQDILNKSVKTIDIQSHSHDLHHYEEKLKAIEFFSKKQIEEDVKKTREILNAEYLSYPYNTYNKYIFDSLEENNFKLAFRGTNHKTFRNEPKYMISRIHISNDMEQFKEIFEGNKYDQTLKDKIMSFLLYIKKLFF